MFHSPLHFCHTRKVWVALDGSVEQCRVINACPPGPCPNHDLFGAADDEYKKIVERKKAAALERRPVI